MATAAKPILHNAIGGLAVGGFIYLVGDTLSDYLTFTRLRSQALQLAEQDQELLQLVGQPYTTGFWYNSTLGFSHRDKVAHCTFQLQGSRRVTDIVVKAGRQQGPASTVLYNILGPGSWGLISCQAMVPSEGGLVQPVSLLPEHRQERQEQQQQQQAGGNGSGSRTAAGSLAACQPCQQQQQQGAEASGSSRWKLCPWGRSSKSSSGSSSGSGNAAAASAHS